MAGEKAPLDPRLKAVAFWIKGPQGQSLKGPDLQAVLAKFYTAFPEYQSSLELIVPPQMPEQAFVFAAGCNGLWPEAGSYLLVLLQQAFPAAEVRPYGKRL